MRQVVARRVAGWAALVAAAAVVTSCNSGSQTAIDLTVQSDAELRLGTIEIIARAAGKPDFHRTATAVATVKISIEVSGLADQTPVTLEAQGIRQGETVIIARARVAVSAGKRVPASIHLEAVCASLPACPADQTCAGGTCVPIGNPGDAGVTEGGSDVSSTGGAGTGGGGTGSGGDGAGGTGGPASTGGGPGATGGVPGGTGGVPGATGGMPGGTGGRGGSGGSGGSGGMTATGGTGTGGRGTGGGVATGGAGTGGMTATGGRGTGGAATGGASSGGAPGKGQGTACTANSECASLHCVESVCCDTDCTGKCSSCKMANTNMAEGKCAAVKAGTAHGSDCTASNSSTCGLDGTCDGAGACRRYPSGTICMNQMCTAQTSTYTAAGTCNGSGTCVPGTSASCINYLCNGTTSMCRTQCGSTTDCVGTAYCAGTTCTPKKAAGQLCGAAQECVSGTCSGRCCSNGTSCMCPQPSTANLLRNPGFDTDISGGWDINVGEGTISWSDQDATGCPYSGSARITSSGASGTTSKRLAQCVAVSPSTTYNFGVRIMSQGGFATCTIDLYPMGSCAGSPSATIDPGTLWINVSWSGALTQTVQTAANTASVYVRCFFPDAGEASFDMMYLSKSPGGY